MQIGSISQFATTDSEKYLLTSQAVIIMCVTKFMNSIALEYTLKSYKQNCDWSLLPTSILWAIIVHVTSTLIRAILIRSSKFNNTYF